MALIATIIGVFLLPWAMYGILHTQYSREQQRRQWQAKKETYTNLRQFKNWRDR